MILETPYEMAISVAERYRNIRKAKKITLKEVTERSGVPYSTIRRFESKGEISFPAFVKIFHWAIIKSTIIAINTIKNVPKAPIIAS